MPKPRCHFSPHIKFALGTGVGFKRACPNRPVTLTPDC